MMEGNRRVERRKLDYGLLECPALMWSSNRFSISRYGD
jgi:hypothetical protein